MNIPPAEEWAKALNLKKIGSQYSGPCPLCGGSDRFHVQDSGNKTLVGCRGCIDGESPETRRSRFLKIVKGTFGERATLRPLPSSKRKQRKAQPSQEENWKKAAQNAKRMIARCKLDTHPYMERKGLEDVRVLVYEGDIFVPIRDIRGQLMSAQLIKEYGEKKFLPGGKVKGGRFMLGRGREPWTVEGLATGFSVYRALKEMERDVRVVIAFSAGNIPNVTGTRGFVVCDNDENKVGEKYAIKSKLPYWMPPEEGDANDFHQDHGLPELVNQLRYFIMKVKKKR